MNNLNLKPVVAIAAACALSLASAAALAAGGTRGGGAPAGDMTRAGATSAHAAAHATMHPGTPAETSRPTPTTAKATTKAHTTGQPNASCEDNPNQPGHSISAPGSAFNPDGVAGKHYAGEQPQNSKNPNSVSQYDVACTRPQH